jgi:hypothetical protein
LVAISQYHKASFQALTKPNVATVSEKKETESVVARRKCYNGEQFLIRWKHHPAKDNSWVDGDEIDSEAKTFIQNFSYKIRGKECAVSKISSKEQNMDSDYVANIGVLFSKEKEEQIEEAAPRPEPSTYKPTSANSVPRFPWYRTPSLITPRH